MASAALRRTAACGSGGRAVAAAQRGGVGGEIESFPHLFPCRFDEFFFYPRNFRKHVVTKNHSLTLRESRCHSGILNPILFRFPNFIQNLDFSIHPAPEMTGISKEAKVNLFFKVFHLCSNLVENSVSVIEIQMSHVFFLLFLRSLLLLGLNE